MKGEGGERERVMHKKYTTIWSNQILYITYVQLQDINNDLANVPLIPVSRKPRISYE